MRSKSGEGQAGQKLDLPFGQRRAHRSRVRPDPRPVRMQLESISERPPAGAERHRVRSKRTTEHPMVGVECLEGGPWITLSGGATTSRGDLGSGHRRPESRPIRPDIGPKGARVDVGPTNDRVGAPSSPFQGDIGSPHTGVDPFEG
jgi:hypothetical protein